MSRLIIGSLVILSLVISNLWFSQSQAQLYGQTQQYRGYGNGSQQNAPDNILIILDASDSMNDPINPRDPNGETKFQAAKRVVLDTVRQMPPGINVGLRVYGQSLGPRQKGSAFGFITGGAMCRQTSLLVPLGQANGPVIASSLLDVEATGKTPITYALTQSVRQDFYGQPGRKKIILVSDGRETCDANPCDAALSMVRSGVNVQVSTIGFATHDPVADDQLKCVALSTKGKFYSADTSAQLAKSLQDSSRIQTNVQAKIFTGQ